MKRVRCIPLLALLLLLTSCTVGPNYKRPPVAVPGDYRGLAPDAGTQTSASFAEEKWFTVFQDEELQKLIHTALANNYDVRIAATRVLQAEAVLGITRADQLPTVFGTASAFNTRVPALKRVPAYTDSPVNVGLGLSWDLDFWGKYRRATEAARAELLASEHNRDAVRMTLVSDVAGSYFALRELDLELEISRRTLSTRQESLRLVQVRQQGGATSMLDVRQSEELVYNAAAFIPALERAIEQQENFISVLLGQNPGPVPRGRPLIENAVPATVPAGLPSSLLERRPDIMAAEQRLVAANARIGAAKALLFPQISLTASAGYQSSALTELFSGPAGFWSFGVDIFQQIFNRGRLRNNVRLTEAQQQEAALVYQRAIQQSFRDVSDALVAYRKNREVREQQQLLAASAQDAVRLSDMRYRGGVTSYLEVLDSDTRYYTAELDLARAQLDERLAMVQLYRALGGGWQP
jgi:multidrug efflux system outer membrane protein